ncbi:MAG TPA: hypothetical protein VJT33_05925 [bacterium]|nr:hypothetical protein [bacterium]
MRRLRALWLAGAMMLTVAALPAAAGPASKPGGLPRPMEIMSRKAGEAFCPAVGLIYRGGVVPAGRCYLISVLRDTKGMFLALAPEDSHIPPGQLVRLDTPAGAKLKGRLFLVPIPMYSFLAPVDTVRLVATQIEDSGTRLSITVVGTPIPNLVVVFNLQI